MSKFILDCSVYISWCLQEGGIEKSSKILEAITKNEISVPSLWIYEVTNTLNVAVKRKRITIAEAHQLIKDIQLLPIELDKPTNDNMLNMFNIANEHNLSAYDASYIELALRTNLPITSFDKDVVKVAKKFGIKIFI